MTSIDGLQRQVNQVAEQIGTAAVGPLNIYANFDFTLFTEHEQQALREFLARLEQYVEGCTIIPQVLAKVTNEELDELEHWVTLRDTRTNKAR